MESLPIWSIRITEIWSCVVIRLPLSSMLLDSSLISAPPICSCAYVVTRCPETICDRPRVDRIKRTTGIRGPKHSLHVARRSLDRRWQSVSALAPGAEGADRGEYQSRWGALVEDGANEQGRIQWSVSRRHPNDFKLDHIAALASIRAQS